MKYKKLIILFVVLIGILILNFKIFIYDEKSLDYTKHADIQQQYHLDLDEINWRYYKCTRWSLFEDTYYRINNPFYRLFDISVGNNKTAVTLYLADNAYAFDQMRTYVDNNQKDLTVKQNIHHRGMDIELEMVRSTTRIPYTQMKFEYKNKYYKVLFYPSDSHDISFYASDKEINQDVLNVYLGFLDKVLK